MEELSNKNKKESIKERRPGKERGLGKLEERGSGDRTRRLEGEELG